MQKINWLEVPYGTEVLVRDSGGNGYPVLKYYAGVCVDGYACFSDSDKRLFIWDEVELLGSPLEEWLEEGCYE